ncbi:MAG: VWA domain-containing protein [Sedimentisphaerales bacterium]|nr:VWA domain-containing protein [Sedimentisphaerales bacterium]
MYLVSLKSLLWLILLVPILISYRYSLVDRPLKYRIAAFVLRILSILLVMLALARPFITSKVEGLHVVFLIDVSESIDLQSARVAVDEIKRSIDKLDWNDSWDIFLVADGLKSCDSAEQACELLDQWLENIPDDQFRRASRLSQALLAARMRFPADKARRAVLFSDGCETHDKIADAMDILTKEHIDVRFRKLDGIKEKEVCVNYLKTNTPDAFEGEKIRFYTELTANSQIPVKIKLLHQAVVVQQIEAELDPNKDNKFIFDVEMTTPGATHWTVEAAAQDDYFPINNHAGCTVNVGGKPRVLILHEKTRQMRPFVKALTEQGLVAETRDNHGVPEQLEELLAFDALILANISATDMKPAQMEMIKRYVTDFGGGLLMLGSNNSYGLGGYFKTPIEEVLPLTSRYEKEKEQPSVAMVLVIDKSGSMNGAPIDLARQAAKATVELLSRQDQIGVVGFDGQAYVVSEMRSVSEAEYIKSAIDSLAASGGTNMYPGMSTAFQMLDTASAKIKHVIILTDGHSQQADFHGLASEMTNAGITLSTVALGNADKQLLASLAEIGRGRYYETTDPSNIPHIFTKETVETSRTAVKEDIFTIVQTGDHPMLNGIDESELPVLLGYVMTRAKPATQLLYAVDTGDPLLAVSRYGLGMGAAFTSDLTDRWSSQWLNWNKFGRFWAQVIRSVVRRDSVEGLFVSQTSNSEFWNIEITQNDKSGRFVSGINWDTQITDDIGNTRTVECRETGLGKYSLAVPIQTWKRCSLRLYNSDAEKMKVLHFHNPYPSEYNLAAKPDPALSIIKIFDIEHIRDDTPQIESRQSIGHICYLLSLLFMVLGLLMRRL